MSYDKKILFVDGGCTNNNQLDYNKRDMVSVVTDEKSNIISEKLEKQGGSNNIAEILAVRNALNYCFEKKIKEVIIYTDSRVNIAWVYNKRLGKKLNNRERVIQIRSEIKEFLKFIDLILILIPRDENLAGIYIENKYNL